MGDELLGTDKRRVCGRGPLDDAGSISHSTELVERMKNGGSLREKAMVKTDECKESPELSHTVGSRGVLNGGHSGG